MPSLNKGHFFTLHDFLLPVSLSWDPMKPWQTLACKYQPVWRGLCGVEVGMLNDSLLSGFWVPENGLYWKIHAAP